MMAATQPGASLFIFSDDVHRHLHAVFLRSQVAASNGADECPALAPVREPRVSFPVLHLGVNSTDGSRHARKKTKTKNDKQTNKPTEHPSISNSSQQRPPAPGMCMKEGEWKLRAAGPAAGVKRAAPTDTLGGQRPRSAPAGDFFGPAEAVAALAPVRHLVPAAIRLRAQGGRAVLHRRRGLAGRPLLFFCKGTV